MLLAISEDSLHQVCVSIRLIVINNASTVLQNLVLVMHSIKLLDTNFLWLNSLFLHHLLFALDLKNRCQTCNKIQLARLVLYYKKVFSYARDSL